VISFFILAGAAAAPFAFAHLWPRRWFKVVWWFAVVTALAAIFDPR